MANYNDGYIYNAIGQDGGFFYNGADFILLLRLHDTFKEVDNIAIKFAYLILNENFKTAEGELILSALLKQTEHLDFNDDMKYSVLFKMADEFGIKDEFIDLIVQAYLYDNEKVLDDVRMLGNILSMDESINLGGRSRASFDASILDDSTVKAIVSIADRYGMKDNIDYVRLILTMYDQIGMTDSEPNPKLSVTDWLIGVSGDLDKAYDWVLPFGLKIDANNTTIATMPEAENITAEILGLDGSLWEDTVYKDRLFSITAYSEQGLSIYEKEQLKTKITEVLDSSKHKSKKMTIQDRGVSFDVKYTGLADIQEGPSYLKAQFNLLAQPYGYRSYEDELHGSGLIDNGQGDAPLGPVVHIKGYAIYPSFSLGDYNYSWAGTIPNGYTLVIDFNMLTCYLLTINNQKQNAMNKFNGTFHKIETGRSEVLQVPSNIAKQTVTTWQTRVLW